MNRVGDREFDGLAGLMALPEIVEWFEAGKVDGVAIVGERRLSQSYHDGTYFLMLETDFGKRWHLAGTLAARVDGLPMFEPEMELR